MRFVLFLISTLAFAGEYTTYIGDTYPRSVAAIATDAAGNTYIAGNRASAQMPTAVLIIGPVPVIRIGTFSASSPPPNDVFVTKLDPFGNVLFTNVFAGKGFDQGLAVAVDPSGNIYVAGSTTSTDFPVSNALQPQPGPYGAGFIVKLSPDGKSILYSTYFGGVGGPTSIDAMTVDSSGNIYLTGTTAAPDFPHTAGMPYTAPTYDPAQSPYNPFSFSPAFVTAISAAGDKILFSGTVAADGSNGCQAFRSCPTPLHTTGVAIALDAAKNVYFGGNADATGLLTTTGALAATGPGAFMGKITANGTGLAYLTYLGSTSVLANGPYLTPTNILSSLTVDSAGNAYIAGNTGDPKFPATAGSYQPVFAGGPVNPFGGASNTDGFVAKLNPTGTAFLWATYLGGNGNDAVNSIAVDAAGDVWAAGTTASPNFPNAQGWSQGGDFLVEFNPTGSALAYSARYPNGSVSEAVALDSTTLIHTAGVSGIVSEIPSTAGPSKKVFGIQNAVGGLLAGRVAPAEVISIYGPHIGPAAPITGTPAAGIYPTTLGGVQVTIGGIPAPLLYASDGQINAVVPMGVPSGAASTIQIGNGSTFPLWIDPTDSQIFPGVLNQNGTLNSATSPAKLGSVVYFYVTGWQTDFSLTDGQVATQANNVCGGPLCQASEGTIVYEGAAPGIVAGVTQFNLRLNITGVTALQQTSIFINDLNAFITIWITP